VLLKRSLPKSIFLLIILSVLVAGCATVYNPATGRDEIIFINTNSETAIGQSAASQIAEKYKFNEDQGKLERLNRIGKAIATVSDRQDIEYQFYLVEDDKLNAFTVPGGHVYIFDGLYKELDDNELACVIAHEIGHVAARHIVKKMQAGLGYQVLSTIGLLAYTRDKDDKKKKQAGYAAYAGATAFNLVMLGYSREDEYEADRLAFKYASKAGFDPQGMVGALEKLKEKEKKGFPAPYILRSHPYIDQRIKRLQAMRRESPNGTY